MMTKKRWCESQPGRISAMRIMTVPGFYVSVIAAFGTSIAIWYTKNANLIALVIAWLGFAVTCLGGKKLQKDQESTNER